MAVYTTIDDPEKYFQVKLYTGNATDDTAITLDGDTDMQPDLIWTKERSQTGNHNIFDSVRGTSKRLRTETNAAEGTLDPVNQIKSFDSDGFTLGTNNGSNENSITFVAYCWKESADSGFDIVSYTGNSTDRTISHSLSAVPKVIIIKNRSTTNWWHTYHHKLGNNYEVYLNVTNVAGSTDAYQSTDPTSSVFSLDDSVDGTNGDGNSLIAYLFAEKQGYSKFGSFEGNSSTDGPFIFTGFRPSMILYKNADYLENWHIQSWKQESLNPNNNQLTPNENYAESSDSNTNVDFLSNGFKIRSSHRTSNYSGNTFVYMAFADAPFVNSNGVPCNAR